MKEQIEKQAIEEMAKDLAETIAWDDDEIPTVDCLETAARLFCKSYRKQSVGEWKENLHPIYGDVESEFVCSVCGIATDDCSNYCPNCGAKMKGENK